MISIKKYFIKVVQILTKDFEYSKLESQIKDSSRPIVIIGTPEYCNRGDHLIAFSEKKFFKNYFSQYDYIEITLEAYRRNKKKICKLLNSVHIEKLVITGGGFLGDIWRDMQLFTNEVIETIEAEQVIIMPQTVYYEYADDVVQRKLQDAGFYEGVNNLVFFTRDRDSYELVKEDLKLLKKCYYVPDIAIYLIFTPIKKSESSSKQILFCIRNDAESTVNKRDLKNILDFVEKQENNSVKFKDTVDNNKIILPHKRKKELEKYISMLCRSKLVITDRLHCMIMCYIYKVPCIAIDNISKKTSGAYKWLRECNYIRCVSDINDCKNYIPDMINCIPVQSDVTNLKLEFDRMANIISNNEILVCKEKRND